VIVVPEQSDMWEEQDEAEWEWKMLLVDSIIDRYNSFELGMEIYPHRWT
jgi:hypothetical protein